MLIKGGASNSWHFILFVEFQLTRDVVKRIFWMLGYLETLADPMKAVPSVIFSCVEQGMRKYSDSICTGIGYIKCAWMCTELKPTVKSWRKAVGFWMTDHKAKCRFSAWENVRILALGVTRKVWDQSMVLMYKFMVRSPFILSVAIPKIRNGEGSSCPVESLALSSSPRSREVWADPTNPGDFQELQHFVAVAAAARKLQLSLGGISLEILHSLSTSCCSLHIQTTHGLVLSMWGLKASMMGCR